ncbi:hypothetical protein [Domibacillus indicus]|uniref:hypothetical protein n=1 Tax=Domibacillus indicus TaxID=1437523 RepID=UPI00061818E5|nr:hypothetical protein [Domibacillus indicus]
MKRSLIDMLLHETPPEDYLKREADELRNNQQDNSTPAGRRNGTGKRMRPELELLLTMAGLIAGIMSVGYVLIF